MKLLQPQLKVPFLALPTNEVSTATLTTVDDVNRATVDDVEHAYWLCGGSIRNMLKACENSENFKKTKQSLENIVKNIGRDMIKLALTETVRGGAQSDSIRSMFREDNGEDEIMHAIQIVDSTFILERLSESLDSEHLFESMKLAENMVEKAVQGVYFELCCHRCFKELIARRRNGFLLKSFVQKDINELTELSDNAYWLPPSNQNFPDIDAAVVHNNILNALQYTVGQKHSFDFDRFWNGVAFVLHSRDIAYSSVRVAFVVPMSTTFTPPEFPKQKTMIVSSDTRRIKSRRTSRITRSISLQ